MFLYFYVKVKDLYRKNIRNPFLICIYYEPNSRCRFFFATSSVLSRPAVQWDRGGEEGHFYGVSRAVEKGCDSAFFFARYPIGNAPVNPYPKTICAVVALLSFTSLSTAAEVRLTLPDVQAEPGEQIVVPLSLAGTADPGIISLRIRILYRGDWLTFVEARQSSLLEGEGFMALANVLPGEDENLLAISVAGTQSLSGEGDLLDLVFQLAPESPGGGLATLRFAEDTRANRGEPVLLTEPGSVQIPLPGDFDGDRAVGFDDFFTFADHFGIRSDEPLFDAVYDLNEDGHIDFDDFFIFADYFGQQH